jgi:putative endonuclease
VTAECGTAAEAVTVRKQRRLAAMAVDYLARQRITNTPCRFDVVAIDDADGPAPRITLYRNAFDSVY